ncbi:transcriptional regulator [Candidatus Micrarchaeota archaeon]|nr:transcriptional regulator [Candidatus Micrarchaeota archaeon]
MSLVVQVAALVLAVIILYILFKVLKELVKLLINSVGALILLFLLNLAFGLGVEINVFSVLIVALSGFAGLVLVLALHFLGIAF